MAITFDEVVTLWKALNPAQRTQFTNAIKQIVADNKDEKSTGVCAVGLGLLKRTASDELKAILDKIIADLNGNQANLKALLNDDIIDNDAERFIDIIISLAEESLEDPADDMETPAVSIAPLRAGLGVANSIGREHLINRRFEDAFWFYLYEASESRETALDILGYTLIMAHHDLFLDARKIDVLKAHKELLFNALLECYNFQISKLDPNEITATLEAYINLLEKLNNNDFATEDLLELIANLEKAKIPFGTFINTHLDSEQVSQYNHWLHDLSIDHKKSELVAQLRGDTFATTAATVVTAPALEKEMAVAQARTERLVQSVDDEASDNLPPLAISSKAVSMAPSRTASAPPSPKRGTLFATTNAPPASPKNSPKEDPSKPSPSG